MERLHLDAVAVFGFRPDRMGLGKQPAGIQRHEAAMDAGLDDQMRKRLILQPEAGGEDRRAVNRAPQQGQPGGDVQTGKEPRSGLPRTFL